MNIPPQINVWADWSWNSSDSEDKKRPSTPIPEKEEPLSFSNSYYLQRTVEERYHLDVDKYLEERKKSKRNT
jgi:uncharacterized Zn-finger protein